VELEVLDVPELHALGLQDDEEQVVENQEVVLYQMAPSRNVACK